MEKEKKIRDIVVPGEILGKKGTMIASQGTYEYEGNIISKFLGIKSVKGNYISVIPLSGVYLPKPGEFVIGIVTDVEKVGWIIDINSPWQGFLSLSEAVDEFIDVKRVLLNRYYDVNDIIYAQVINARKGDVQLTMRLSSCKKLKDGVIVKITPSKVPRLIGKEGSMVNMIKEKTKTIIRVGQNGVVWVSGEEIDKAILAIKTIDEKSHIYGLTDEISNLLSD